MAIPYPPPSEVDGEVFDGVVKDKEQAEKEFNMSVTQGRTAGTVVQRYATHHHAHFDTQTFRYFRLLLVAEKAIEVTYNIYWNYISFIPMYIVLYIH